MTADFQPGDRIVKHGYGVKPRTFTVLDPVRTKQGKLRVARESGYVATYWWSPEWLPSGYYLESNES